MTTKAKVEFTKVDESMLSLLMDNIFWGVATQATNLITRASVMQRDFGASIIDEDAHPDVDVSPYKKGDAVHALLVEATTLIDAALLDGLDESLLSAEVHDSLAQQYVERKRKFDMALLEKNTFVELSNDVDFYMSSPEEQLALVKDTMKRKVRTQRERDETAMSRKTEAKDIAEGMTLDVLGVGNQAVTGNGDYQQYLDIRGQCILRRVTNLRSDSSMIDGQWVNRTDFNQNPIPSSIEILNDYADRVIDEGIRLRYTMPQHTPNAAEVDAKFAKMVAIK